jgi:hypothetical protein
MCNRHTANITLLIAMLMPATQPSPAFQLCMLVFQHRIFKDSTHHFAVLKMHSSEVIAVPCQLSTTQQL